MDVGSGGENQKSLLPRWKRWNKILIVSQAIKASLAWDWNFDHQRRFLVHLNMQAWKAEFEEIIS